MLVSILLGIMPSFSLEHCAWRGAQIGVDEGETLERRVVEVEAQAPAPTDTEQDTEAELPPAYTWHDVTEWGVEGRAFESEARARWFDRLPASAEATVRKAVWDLSRDSAGMLVRFETDASEIRADYRLRSDRLAMPHMPATGVSGIDLYARDDTGGWRWVGVTKPTAQDVRTTVATGLAPGRREYAAYLPLYNGVEHVRIGVPEGAAFVGLAPRTARPIVFYGTSITHGACASRPGLVHTAILGRRLERPVMNLGFSGNGRMEAEVGVLLARIDAAVFVIDCNPNMQADAIAQRCAPLVRQLRGAHPTTPIVLVEDRRFTNDWIVPGKHAQHDRNHAALREAFVSLQREGVAGLFYLAGDGLLGEDGEGSTDGSHPNDLGFMRQADAFEPVLRRALEARESRER